MSVTAICLERSGDYIIVRVQRDGNREWVEVIREFDPYIPDVSPPHSHIVNVE